MRRRLSLRCAAAYVTGTALLVGLVSGCASGGRAGAGAAPAPRFEGLGAHTRAVSTRSPEAQHYFDQGLVWAYAFNHDEAIRSFRTAAQHDPELAMAWWGVALCNGPHINFPAMEPAQSRDAWEALQAAQQHAGSASPVEQELIAALAARYSNPAPADRRPLDEAYAAAMKQVWQRHPDDADIGTLYAESLMDLQPWDLWTKDGQPKGNTPEILAVLDRALALDPDNPGANHLYIHALEASPHPERANVAADRLRRGVPISGHLVHMPSHIDVQCGRWALAADQNEQAIESHRRYREISPRQNFYRVYMAHNHHFLAFAAMMEGRSAVAEQAAREMVAGVPRQFIEEHGPWIDPLMSVVLDTLKRFGRWDEVLKEPRPPRELPITTAMWYFTRGVAFAAKGDVPAAEREQREFREAVRAVPADAMMAINPAHHVLSIADHMLAGEIAYARGELDASVAELKRAIALEDDLKYMEPPEWIQPVRHTLGAVLVSAGRYEEAERVYREDLAHWPENGWSLHGLARCLEAQGKAADAAQVAARFAATWARADVQIESSCLCVPGGQRRADATVLRR